MSENKSLCYLDDDGQIVGLHFVGDGWEHDDGEVTNSFLPYPYTRVLPLEGLTVDDGVIRELTQEELNLKYLIAEGEDIRNEAAKQNILVHNAIWKMGDLDRANIQDAIDEGALHNLPEETTQNWILANGDIFPATQLHLKQVLSAYRRRKQDIYNAYILWLKSGSPEEFTYLKQISYYSVV